jgi:uncharacterized protein YndB with AHSA1/START domain
MSGRELVIERILPATPADVFAAWSDADGLATWMCPGDLSGADVELDFRVGGRFAFDMRGGDQPYAHHGEYLVIEPPKRLVMRWVSEWMPEGERDTRVTVTFEAQGEGATRIRIHHEELPESDSYDGHAEGWASILSKLDERLRRSR